MLSSSMISPHLFTTSSGISDPSAISAELSSFPCMPTTVLNHILLPFLSGNTRISCRGPRMVFTPSSDVPKASSHPRPLMDLVSFLLGALKLYLSPFSSISFTFSGNSSSILSVTRKLGTKGVSPPSGGGTSQKRITLDHLVVVVYELRERALVGGPNSLVDVSPWCRTNVAYVFPPEGVDDLVEVLGVAHIVAPQENCALP